MVATSIEEVENLHEAIDSVPSVEDYDASIDAEEEGEDADDSLEALDDRLNSFNAPRTFNEDF